MEMEDSEIILPCVTVPYVFLPGQAGTLTITSQSEDAPEYRLLSDCYRQKKSVALIVLQHESKNHYYALGAVAMLQDMSPAQIVAGGKVRFTFNVIGRYQLSGFTVNADGYRMARAVILPVPEIYDEAWQSDGMRNQREEILELLRKLSESYAVLPWEGINAMAEANDDLRTIVEDLKVIALRTQLAVVRLAAEPNLSYDNYYRLAMVYWMAFLDNKYKARFLEADDVAEQIMEILYILEDLLADAAEIDRTFREMISKVLPEEPPVNKNLPDVLNQKDQPPRKKSGKDFSADSLAKLETLDKRLVALLDKILRKGGDDSHE